jgi:hypothetical protein
VARVNITRQVKTLTGWKNVSLDRDGRGRRYLGEQHVREDLGRIPTAQDWLSQIKPQRWMYGQRLAIERSRLPSDVK